MAKFPSQRKLMYAGAAVSNGNFAETHKISLPKDLSIVNRRGYASTTRKGVPLVFRVAATVFPTGLDGSGYVTSVSSDVKTTIKFQGCQNNWVMKNAAVKFHAAKEAMLRKAGVRKSQRGAYDHEIRYGFSANDTFADTVDGDGAAFAGGTWDLSQLVSPDDSAYVPTLVGSGDDEDADEFAGSILQIGHSYLMSRASAPEDSNDEREGPATHSVLNAMLGPDLADSDTDDNVVYAALNYQDNPPYDRMDVASGDVDNDITEPVELGRLNLYPQGSGGSIPMTTVLDVPFGIMRVLMAHRDPGDNSGITDDLCLGLEVLDIFEMQG